MYQHITFEDGTEGIVQMEGFGTVLFGAAVALGIGVIAKVSIDEYRLDRLLNPIIDNHLHELKDILSQYEKFKKSINNNTLIKSIFDKLSKSKLGEFEYDEDLNNQTRRFPSSTGQNPTFSNTDKSAREILLKLCRMIYEFPKLTSPNRYLERIGRISYSLPVFKKWCESNDDSDIENKLEHEERNQEDDLNEQCKRILKSTKSSGFQLVPVISPNPDEVGAGDIEIWIAFNIDYPKYKDLLKSIVSEVNEIINQKKK